MARFSELLLALVTCHVIAVSNADVSSQGLEFVFSIPSYAWGGATRCDPRIILTTSVPETVNVNITVWAINIKEQATLTNADSVTVSLLSTACLPRGSGIQPQTVLVQSTRPISVHVFNADSAFGEGFLALPKARLGKTYYVTAFALTEQQSSYGSRPGFAAVSATDVQTTVEVTPKGGDSYTVDLQPYETYLLETNNDPTGTRLSANKPVSVIAGLVCGSVPEGSTRCSFLIEQLPSVNQLGHYFIVGPFMGRAFGYVCRIVGVNQTLTNVNVSNSDSIIQLKAGEKHDIDISDNTVLEILSDKAVIVMQYMKYWDVTNDEDDYASMMVVPAVEFFSGNVKFPVFPIPTYYSYYTPRYSAHVVVKCEYASGLTFDGAPMTGELLRSDSGNMCILYKQVTPGVHGIEHVNATFSVVVSGTSYGYPAAFNLKKDAEEDDVIFARIGDTVILPCNKTMPTPAPSRTYSPYLLEWVRTDLSYLILRNSSSTPPYIDDRYKGRVSIVNDLALKIDDLRIDDSGWYKCQIINLNDLNDRISPLNNENSSHLVVLEKSTTTPTPLEPTPTTTTQNPETSVDIGTQGQEFVFAIPRPDSDCNPRIILTTSAAETVNVDITISAINLRKEAIVNSADSVTVTVPSSGCLASGTGIKAGTVRVTSTRPISVHVFNTDASGGDGFLALPIARLGRIYYVTAFRPKSGRPSFAAISATDVQTTVEVTPKGGDSYNVNLQPYETYQLEQNSDPTGTRLSANKPIAVVAGSVCATIPIGTDYFTDYSCGSILEQLPSVHQLGHNFVLGAYPGHRSGYICRIVGVNETVTDVKASNSDRVINLNAGEFVDIDVEFVTDPQTIEISSDKPVLVMQYMKYSINDRGDASMNLVPPIDLFTGKINFPVFKMAGEEAKYGVNVAAECRYGQSLIFDGGNVYSWDIERSGNSGSMCVSRREVTTGMHVMEPGMLTMEHKTAKFYIVVCGYRWDSSYCYPAAFNLNKAPLFEATPNSYSECYTEANGQDYRGQTSTTERGNICQKWTSQTPHSHDITTEYWPGTGIGDHNYCRNPSGGPRAWCYTIDPAVRREYCDIGQPSNTCDLSVREDGRCGPGYFAPNANEGECHPEGEGPCCSAYGWCGITDVHCVTSVYKDYRGNVIVGNVVKSRDRTVPGNFFVILPNDPIPGDGFVTGWRAYPTQQHTQGTFRALVLSPDPSGDDSIWTIVGVYDIPAASSTASDIYTYTIPTDQHIPVHKDYVIGVAYMENGGPQLDATSTSINTQNRYISISSPTELNVGDELTFNNLGNLEISFAAIVRLTDQAPTETVPTEVTSKVPEAGDTGQCYECLGQIGIPGFPDIEPNCFDPFNSAGIATPECVGKCFANYTSTSIFGSTFQRVQRGCITNPVECLPSAYCQDVPAPDGSGTSRYCSYCCDGGKCNSQGLEEAASGSTSCWNCQANITESMEVTPGSCSSDDFIGGTLPDVIPVPCQGMCVIANVPAGLLGESAQFLRTCDQFGLCAPGGPPPGFENVVFKCCEGDKCNVGGIDGDDAGVVITSTMKTGQPTAKAPTSEAPSTEVLEKRTNVGSQGLEFVFAIPSHDWGCTPRIILTTSAPETVNVNITISAININQATLNSTDSMTVNLLNTACLSKGSGIKQKTVVVKSTRPISVHVFNTDSFLGEGFLALPTAQLGRAYYVAAFSPTGTGPAFAAISATDVQTTVEVTPKAGDSYTVDLQPYETYMLETTYDPTGTRLSANKPISVVAGNSKMLEQLPSVDQLGQYFVVGPFVGRPFGYVCRIVGVSEKLTNVSISNSNSPIQLGAGDKYDVDITDETVLEISSDRPVQVMQYMKYTGLKDYEDDAASMVLVPAVEFFSGNVNFPVFQASTPTTSTPIYNIHVVAKCEYASSLTFNGAAMTGEILRSASGNMCILRKQVTTGMHGIEHVNATFYIVVYGSSYGYPAAFNLNRGVPSYGKLIGSFTTKAHGVTGKVYAATDKRLYITEFNYDGGAPDAFVWMGNTDTVGSTGEIIPVNGSSDVLSRYSNDVVQLDLPGSKTLADYKWVSIWCRTFRENFGDLYFSDIDVPSGPFRNTHNMDHEFIFAIPVLYPFNHPAHVLISTSTLDTVYITLSIRIAEFMYNGTVSKYNHLDITLPMDVPLAVGEGKSNKTIIVRSSHIVSVYGIDNELVAGDGFMAIPSSQLGTQYYVASYSPVETYYPSSICVSALNSETSVTVTTKAGQEYQITLNPYESYRFDGDDYEDLSGTRVLSDKPVAVISGVYTYVPVGVSHLDGLLEQLPPVQSWGYHFILAPFQSISSGYIYRVFAANEYTTLYLSTYTVQIQAEDFYEGDVTGNEVVSFKTDQPVMVVQYMKGGASENPRRGDPSMMVVPPISSSLTNHVTFSVIERKHPSGDTYYINVITNCSHINGFLLDDAISMADWNQLATDDQSMCVLRNNISVGNHGVSHTDMTVTFSVSVYAFFNACCSSYLYPASVFYLMDQSTTIPTPPVPKPTPTTQDPECTGGTADVGWDLVTRTSSASANYIFIFPLKVIPWDGVVTEWSVKAKEAWPLFATVFRPVTSDGTFKIIGINQINSVIAQQVTTYTVPSSERIQVKQNDVIGFISLYPSTAVYSDNAADNLYYYARYTGSSTVGLVGATFESSGSSSSRFSIQAKVMKQCDDPISPQERSADIGSQGQEFVFAIPRPDSDCNPRIILTTSATETVSVDITISAINMWRQAAVTSTDSVTVTVPSSACLASGSGIQTGTVKVVATMPISVHVFNTDASGGDGFLAIPTEQLGTTYYIAAFTPTTGRPSFAVFTATDFQTTVEVTPKGGHSYRVTLQPYETYQLEANSDPTGTRLSANKPIAVVAGSVCAAIPVGGDPGGGPACDSILEQLPSVHQLGHNFVLGPYMGHRAGYICRIVGVNGTLTNVEVSGSYNIIQLNAGDFYDIDIEFVTDPQIIEISSDKPVLVMQYMKFSVNDRGDASMNLVPAVDFFAGNVNFPVFKVTESDTEYGVQVAVECKYAYSLIFDGAPMTVYDKALTVYQLRLPTTGWELLRSDSESMCMLRNEVTTGVHIMEHAEATFYIVVCGYSYKSSYCYPAAFNLNKGPLLVSTAAPGSYTECYTEAKGQDYRGHTSSTQGGKVCQKWTSQTPHDHSYTPENRPGTGIGDHNYCRNPGGDPKAWCYTIDPATRWDYCDIGKPSSSCDSQPITEAITSAAPTTTAPTTSAPTTTTAPTTSAPTTSGPTTSAPTTSAPSTLGSPGGFEYVFAIPEIYYAVAFPYVLITTTSLDPVHTSLSIPGFAYEVNNEVTRYKQASIRLSVADGIARIADPGMSSKTIIVRSTAPVTVHAFDNDYCCTDGFLVLPTSNLGTEYYIATYAPDSTRNPSFLTVSALDYKTEVDIVTKAGQKTHITLQAYMSYRFNGGDYEDLTNTYIRSERPVSVVTGVYTKTTREENASGMVVNIEPVSSWGKSFVLAPFKTKTCGYAYRVLSSNQSNQDTILTISNIGTVQLQAGDYYEGVVTRLKMITITSTLPILVVQYMKYSCNDRWNPAMFQVAPVDTFYNEVTFPVFSYDNRYTKNYFINVIIDCDYVDGLVFDNVVTNLDQLTTDDQSICAILAEISTGPHHVRTTYPEAKFTVSVYLMCSECSTSFAYRAGVTPTAITRLTIPPLATSETSYTGDITCHVCKVGGFEYVFAIPETYAASSKRLPNVLLTTSSLDSVSVTLTIPGLLFEVKSTITKNEPATITLPVTARVADSGKSSKTVIVSASAAVTVHAFDNDCCGDGFLAIPTSNLGIEYYVVAYVPNDIDYPSSFTVSALQHETSVYFATKTQPDYPLRVDLKPFESYRYVGGDYEDITSTYIRSDRPVSVISAAFTQLNIGYYPGGMLVNIQPVSRWGKKFVLAPFMTKTCGYLYRVQSINQDTILTISDIGTVDLQAGEYYEGDVTDETLTTIQSDLPVLVVQYLKDYHACNYNGLPSMMEVTPTESYYNNVTFPVFEVTVANPEKLNYFINVITNCNNVNGLRLNDTRPMVNWNRLTTRDGSMCALRSEITPGLYSVGNTDPSAKSSVSVYMMCKGTCVTSYTYQAGAVSAAPFATPAPTTPTTTQPMTTLETVVGPIGQVACKTCKAVEVFCNETAMTAVFKTSALPFKRPSDVHLWDPSCEASEYGRKQAILTTNYDMCNTTTQESRGYMVFKNALILGPDNPNSLNLPPQVTIECRVKSQQGAVTSSKLYYNLEIFQDATYGTPYGPEEYPVDVKVGDEVYVAGSVTTVPEQHLFIESCWATPTTDQYHEASYSLITNGCSNDLSLTRYNFADPNVELFSFKSFAFRNNWLVFIHCQMLVCDVSTPDSRCKQGCLMDSSTGSEPLLRRSNDNTHTVTSGPLVVRGKWCAHREC